MELEEGVFLALFTWEFQHDIECIDERVPQEAQFLLSRILERLRDVDEIIKKYSQRWSFDRIDKPELTILRMGIYFSCIEKLWSEEDRFNKLKKICRKYASAKSFAYIVGVIKNAQSEQ